MPNIPQRIVQVQNTAFKSIMEPPQGSSNWCIKIKPLKKLNIKNERNTENVKNETITANALPALSVAQFREKARGFICAYEQRDATGNLKRSGLLKCGITVWSDTALPREWRYTLSLTFLAYESGDSRKT